MINKILSLVIIFTLIFININQHKQIKIQEDIIENRIIKITKYYEVEPEDTIENAIIKAAEYIGVNPKFVEAQWRLETGHFTSDKFINNNNFAGIAVYTKNHEGAKYINYEHCAYAYAMNVRQKYPQVLCAKTIDEFVNGLQDYKYKWAEDKLYKNIIKDVYSNMNNITYTNGLLKYKNLESKGEII